MKKYIYYKLSCITIKLERIKIRYYFEGSNNVATIKVLFFSILEWKELGTGQK